MEALGTVQRKLLRDDDVSRFDVSAFVREFAAETARAPDRTKVRLRLDLDPVEAPASHATPVALLVRELVRLATQRAAAAGVNASISLSIKASGVETYRFCLDDGEPVGATEVAAELSSRRFVELLAGQLGAQVHWNLTGPLSHNVCVDLPTDSPSRRH